MDKFYKLDYRHPTRVGYEELSIVFFSSLDKVIIPRFEKG